MVKKIVVIGLENLGHVRPGDDVAQLIFNDAKSEGHDLMDDDIIVVSHKIISKADGLLVNLASVKPSRRAVALAKRTGKDPRLMELILRDSARVLRADREAIIVQRRDEFICLNAGVDKSNVDGRVTYSRLPEDADAAARDLRLSLERSSGKRLAVVVGDTYSRPFRVGQVEFAIGVSGIEPIVDYRGQEDMFGYKLRFKYVGLADEIAAAAELVMGQGTEQIPVAIVRGLPRVVRNESKGLSKKLLMDKKADLFSHILQTVPMRKRT